MPEIEHRVASLRQALSLVAADRKERTFYDHPFELAWVQSDLQSYLQDLATRLDAATYTPAPARPVDVPKPGWHLRPGSILTLDDHVVYSHLVLAMLPWISARIEWSEFNVRSSHLLSNKAGPWFRNAFTGWSDFQKRTATLLTNPAYKHVLFSDIAGFYENIDIGRLIDLLREVGGPPGDASLLSTCLNKWAVPRRRGIPQSFSPSDVLAELYLDTVDRSLQADGFVHVRYLDDFHLFAPAVDNARRGLHRLTVLLRERGLNIQAQKSNILSAKDARKRVNAIDRQIRKIGTQLAREIIDLGGPSGPRAHLQLKALLQAKPDSPPPQVLTQTWREFESRYSKSPSAFNKTLFHYLLRRLSDAKLDLAVDFCLSRLEDRPEETEAVLDYLSDMTSAGSVGSNELDVIELRLRSALLEYQQYEILRWFYTKKIRHEGVMAFARSEVKSGGSRDLVRPYAIALVGRYGEQHDFESIQAAYIRSESVADKATLVSALKFSDKAMRNSFYARCRGEHPMIDRAIRWAQA